MEIRGPWLIVIPLVLWLFLPGWGACEQIEPTTITKMNHRAWMVMNGAPADIWAMQQDENGFIWLATGSGLFRFDGLQFKRYMPPNGERFLSTDMTAIEKLPNGELWIGASNGAISRVKDGHVTNYPIASGAPRGVVFDFAATQDGALWVIADHRLLRYAQGQLQSIGSDWNFLPTMEAMWMVVDRHGTAWLATSNELLFLRKGAHRFEHTGIPTGLDAVLALSPDDTLWLSDGLHGTRALPGLAPDHIPASLTQSLPYTNFAQSKRLMFDRHGALWGTLWPGNGIEGVYRITDPAQLADGRPLQPQQVTDTYTTAQGLTSIVAVPLLADHEGNVWVGTNFGLNSFHLNSFTVASPAKGEPSANTWLAAGDGGHIWLIQGSCLYRVQHAQPMEATCGLPAHAYGLFAHGTTVWIQTPETLYKWSGQGQATQIPLPDGQLPAHMTAAGTDAQGHLWMGLSDGLYELTTDGWRHIDVGHSLTDISPTAIAFDSDQSIWLGYADSKVVHWDGKEVHAYTIRDGLDVGNVQAIAVREHTVLVSGEAGVARWNEGHFQSISIQRMDVLSTISGVAETASGDIWLNTSVGIVLIRAAEAQRAFQDTSYIPRYKLFGSDDGVPGIALRQPLVSSISMDEDARLWFGMNQGVWWIDPSQVSSNTIPPHVLILSLSSGGAQYAADGPIALPPHTNTVSLQFTAASFISPERVNFRYRLSRVDKAWQEGGMQREAVYANLTPGNYLFQVMAANSDGVWSKEAASIQFRIKSAFYQTRYFQVAFIVAALLLMIALAIFQYRRMLGRLHERLEIRHSERERIARELHDTLLQGIQGLILRFHAIGERIPRQDPTRVMIDQALDRADEVLVDGRNRVRDLRVSDNATKDLAVAFAALGKELSQQHHPVMFRVVSSGTQQETDPVIREEVYLIGREALINAFQHANANEIEVEIAYDLKQLRICVRDNGIGIDSEILQAGRKPGHWGLVGMRERAGCIGGQLKIWARPGLGVDIELMVPAAIAYARKQRMRGAWLKQLVSWGR